MSSDKSNQLLIREAIRKIALGRSMERINLAPGGMSGIGTARMIPPCQSNFWLLRTYIRSPCFLELCCTLRMMLIHCRRQEL